MTEDMIETIRAFNRYYTAWLNVLNKSYLGSRFSWPESRTLFEVYLHPGIHAAELCAHLRMDKSYASRLLARFEKEGLLRRELVPGSRGVKRIYLTPAGLDEARQIDRRGRGQIMDKLAHMDAGQLDELCRSMLSIETLLRESEAQKDKTRKERSMNLQLIPAYDHPQEVAALFSEYTDMLVAGDPAFKEYLALQNYDEELRHLDAKYGAPYGRLYLALCDGAVAGCIGLRRIDERCCELKRLYVRPQFRGHALGELLVRKVIDDAVQIGYSAMLLDTLPFLQSALKLYERLGFTRVERYNNSPMDTSIYMKLDLNGLSASEQ